MTRRGHHRAARMVVATTHGARDRFCTSEERRRARGLAPEAVLTSTTTSPLRRVTCGAPTASTTRMTITMAAEAAARAASARGMKTSRRRFARARDLRGTLLNGISRSSIASSWYARFCSPTRTAPVLRLTPHPCSSPRKHSHLRPGHAKLLQRPRSSLRSNAPNQRCALRRSHVSPRALRRPCGRATGVARSSRSRCSSRLRPTPRPRRTRR